MHNTIRKRLVALLSVTLALIGIGGPARATMQTIVPGADSFDSSGNLVRCTDTGIFQQGGTYYIYGTARTGAANTFQQINMYSSTDLVHWTYVNAILTSSQSGLSGMVVERPTILYNSSTNTYVMLFHYENSNYSLNEVGVATSSTLTGNYTFQTGFQPMGHHSLDLKAFEDTDGSAYLFSTDNTESPQTDYIYRLNSSYTGVSSQVFSGASAGILGEGSAIVKVGSIYYWCMSSLTGWNPNDNFYYYTTSLGGPWTYGGNIADPKTSTDNSQSGAIATVTGTQGTSYVYMGVRWDGSDLENSRLVWLPMIISGNSLKVNIYDQWQIDTSTGLWQYPGPFFASGGIYTITNAFSGQAIQVSNDSTAQNASIVQEPLNSADTSQQWVLAYVPNQNAAYIGEGCYTLQNVKSGLYMRDPGDSMSAGVQFQQSSASNSAGDPYADWWFLLPDSKTGKYKLENQYSQLLADDFGASTNPGNPIGQWDNNGGSNQEWTLTPVASNVPSVPANVTASSGNSQISLSWSSSSGVTSYNVYRGTTSGGEGGTPIATGITAASYTDTGLTNGTAYYYKVAAVNGAGTSAASNEASTTAALPNGTYQLTPACATGSRLDGYAWGTTNGTNVDIWTSNNLAVQQWIFTNMGGGWYKIQPAYDTALSVEVWNMGTTNGTNVDLWADWGGTNQRWSVNTVSGGNMLAPENAPGQSLNVNGNGGSGSNVQIWQWVGESGSIWTIQ